MPAFPVTRQTILERIRSADVDVRRTAFGDLAAGYWRPSYHYVRLHWGLSPDEAEDVIQAFFATAFEKGYVERYDQTKARFRTFLRTCLDRYVQNHRKAERAQKRGGGARLLSLDFPDAEREIDAVAARDRGDLDRFFHDETIRALFARTVAALRAHYERDGREVVFQVFDLHDLRPTPDTTYGLVADRLGLSTTQVTNHLHAARKRFRELALTSLRDLCGSDEEYRHEARELFGLELS